MSLPIPWILGGLGAYFVLSKGVTARQATATYHASSTVQQPPQSQHGYTTGSPGGTWTQPGSQPNTANGANQTAGDIVNVVAAATDAFGSLFDWMNPPSAADTQGGQGTPVPGATTVYPGNNDSGFTFMA